MLLLCFLFSGCTAVKLKNNIVRRATLVERIEQKQKKIESHQKAIIISAINAIKNDPQTPQNKYVIDVLSKLSDNLSVSDDDFIDAAKILNGNKEEIVKLDNSFKFINEERKNITVVKKEVSKIDYKIKEEAEKLVKIERKNIIWGSIGWISGSLGLIGIILLCIFVPAFLPLVISFIKGVTNIIVNLIKK